MGHRECRPYRVAGVHQFPHPVPNGGTVEVGLNVEEVGLAIARLGRVTGQRLIHVAGSAVCEGPGENVRYGRPEVGPQVVVRMPEALRGRIDAAAASAGVTRAEWVRDACAAALTKD